MAVPFFLEGHLVVWQEDHELQFRSLMFKSLRTVSSYIKPELREEIRGKDVNLIRAMTLNEVLQGKNIE